MLTFWIWLMVSSGLVKKEKKTGEELPHAPISATTYCILLCFAFLPVTNDKPPLILSQPLYLYTVSQSLYLKEIILALVPLATSSVLHFLDSHQHIDTLYNVHHPKNKVFLLTAHSPQITALSLLPLLHFMAKLLKGLSLSLSPLSFLFSLKHTPLRISSLPTIPSSACQGYLCYPYFHIQGTTVIFLDLSKFL